MISGLNLTFGFTNHFWGQFLLEYYSGDMEYDFRTGYIDTVPDEFGRDVETSFAINYDAQADITTLPVSLNIGYSFLEEGKYDPYVSFGPTWYSVDIDSTTAGGELYQLTDKANEFIYVGNRSLNIDDYDDNTIGFNVGIGLNYFVKRSFALCADVRYYWGEADFDLDNDLDVGGFRLTAGFKYVFGK